MSLHLVPLELDEANRAVSLWHRHHQPVHRCRFSIGCVDDAGLIHGAAMLGRPVARNAGLPRNVLEVLRVATDGTPNACSILLGAAARIARDSGFRRIQTYTLPEEGGASLRAAGWLCEGLAGGGQWVHTDGKPRRTDQPTSPKYRWAKEFNVTRPDAITWPDAADDDPSLLDLIGEGAA